jgi:hypothetical protein
MPDLRNQKKKRGWQMNTLEEKEPEKEDKPLEPVGQ